MNTSFWLKDSSKKYYSQLEQNLEVDILIVGGGITGILCAYQLSQENKYRIALIEKNELYHSTTGYTTGKITFQHDDIYHRLLNSKGYEMARLYYEANNEAVNSLINMIQEKQIDCAFQTTDAYLFAMLNNEKELSLLKEERNAYQKLNIPHEWIDKQVLPIASSSYLKVCNQGAFHVVKFLDFVLNTLNNVSIFEQTKIIKTYQSNDETIAITSKNYQIKAKHLILATHYPFYKRFNFFFTILKPTVSYALIMDKYRHFEDGVYINLIEPIISIRSTYGQKPKLLMAGFGHDSYQFKEYVNQIQKLQEEAIQSFDGSCLENEWYNQDYQSFDLVPLIGRIKNTNIYMASAYNKWGMSTSFLASTLIKDIIVKQNSKYEKLFSPNRSFFTLKTVWYNFLVGFTIFRTKVMIVPKKKILPGGTGAILGKGMRKIGVYVDTNNQIHLIKPVCTHMGCSLRFNNVSKTYDCPCHGSRFNYDGVAIDGPAPRNLKKY